MENFIFVFGSNLAGVHGAGAAKEAHEKHGAVWGRGVGHHGNSYAIPTKDFKIETLDLTTISLYVDKFLDYARSRPELQFKVTRVGCGLAGLQDKDVARMFMSAPRNCQFDEAWKRWMPAKQFWGTYP